MHDRILMTIDPGGSGGVAWRDLAGEVHVEDLPASTIELKSKRANGKCKERTIVDAYALADLITSAMPPASVHVIPITIGIEALFAGAAKMSAFSALLQGANFGRVEGVALAIAHANPRREVTLIESREWRAFHGIKGKDYEERKAQAVLKALELFPHHEIIVTPPPKMTKAGKPSKRQPAAEVKDGRADALLMLAYLIHKHEREGQ